MASDHPDSRATTDELQPIRNGNAGSIGGLVLRVFSTIALLVVIWLDEANPDWDPPTVVLIGLIAAVLGIDGREAVDLLKTRFGGK